MHAPLGPAIGEKTLVIVNAPMPGMRGISRFEQLARGMLDTAA